MSGRAPVLVASGLALVLTACSLYVAGALEAADATPEVPDFSSSGASGRADPCALTPPDAGTACAQCIATSCGEAVDDACRPEAGAEYWFATMQECAQRPEAAFGARGQGWGCAPYDEDAGDFTGTSEPAREAKAHQCIREKCMLTGTNPCVQCPVYLDPPGASTQPIPLEESACGRCIRNRCNGWLLYCCAMQFVETEIAHCGFAEGSQDSKTRCKEAIFQDAGTPPEATDRREDRCAYGLPQCIAEACEVDCR